MAARCAPAILTAMTSNHVGHKGYAFATLTIDQAQHVAGWRYEPPFDAYNIPIHLRLLVAHRCSDARHRTFGIFDRAGFLAACCVFGGDARLPGVNYDPHSTSDTDILDCGLWLNPTLVRRGTGYRILIDMLAFGRQQWRPLLFRASISEDNTDVQRLAMRAGFKPSMRAINRANQRQYVIMLMDAKSDLSGSEASRRLRPPPGWRTRLPLLSSSSS
jgi:RimJ/RimL family protein N-acetyltransferase